MKKYHSIRSVRARKRKHPATKATRVAVFGMALAVALAPSAAPELQANQLRLASLAPPEFATDQEVALSAVSVGFAGGSTALSRQWLDISSAAPGLPVAALPGSAAKGNLFNSVSGGFAASGQNGQQVSAQRLLPGKIQLIHPVTTRFITSRFGWRKNPTGAGHQTHIGQDYGIACGSPVYASADGIVVVSAWAGHSGMRVTIEHGSAVRTGYSHNSKLIAKVGDFVKKGQVIALSGTTGNSTGCHVHFEVIINGQWQDPQPYLPGANGQPGTSINAGRTLAVPALETRKQGPTADPGHDVEIDVPDQEPSDKPEAKPAASKPSPKPSVEASPTPSPKPTTKPASKPSPTPTTSPAPKPSPKPSPTPAPKPTPTPTPSQAPKPTPTTASPTPTKPKPSPTPTTSPAPKPLPTPTTSPAPTPSAEPAAEPATESTVPKTPVVSAPAASTEPVAKPKPAPAVSASETAATDPALPDGSVICGEATAPSAQTDPAAAPDPAVDLPCIPGDVIPVPGDSGNPIPPALKELG